MKKGLVYLKSGLFLETVSLKLRKSLIYERILKYRGFPKQPTNYKLSF